MIFKKLSLLWIIINRIYLKNNDNHKNYHKVIIINNQFSIIFNQNLSKLINFKKKIFNYNKLMNLKNQFFLLLKNQIKLNNYNLKTTFNNNN